MNSKACVVVAGLAASLALAGCHKGGGQPTGQVVATVDGKEITASDLNIELAGYTAPDPKTRKAAEQAALQNIVARKVLADAAEKAKVDKTPQFAQQQQRANEALLVQTWQSQIAKAVPKPSRDEAEKFVTDHPEMYAERKIWTVDQIRAARPTDPALLAQLKPLNSLDDIAAVLAKSNLDFRRATDQVDTLALNPKLVSEIQKLPPGEVFIIPSGNAMLINKIRDTRVEPLTGDPAVQHATNYLYSQHVQEAVQRQMASAFQQAKNSIKYSKAYQPPSPPKAAPAKATPAAPAAPAQK